MKTYTGTVVRASHDTQTPNVTIAVLTLPNEQGTTRELTMHCGTRIAVDAVCLIGRKVQFQAELSERTQCLTDIQLCVRSEYGLRAVREDTRESGVRESQRPLAPGSAHGGLTWADIAKSMGLPRG
jgi:hypothetical protein